MAKKLYDLAVIIGNYTQDGEDKAKWQNVGVIMESDDKRFILLNRTFNPAGVKGTDDRENILISMFKPKKKKDKDEEEF